MVVRLTPNANLVNPAEITAAFGDAVKAIARKLRREDSLYHFSEGVFGIMLPGVSVQNARIVAARLTEGLHDVSGALGRVSSTTLKSSTILSMLPLLPNWKMRCGLFSQPS